MSYHDGYRLQKRIIESAHKTEMAREMRSAGHSVQEISDATGYSQSHVSSITSDLSNGRASGVEIPRWVPAWLRADYHEFARMYGEEKAASECRKLKAEAGLSVLPFKGQR